MKREQAAERIAKLRSEIRHHEYLYYVEDRPEVSDEEFDRLFHALEALEAEHPDLVAEDSPTQRVAGTPSDSFPTVEHAAPMLSLDSSQDEAALRRFDERLRKGLGAAGRPPPTSSTSSSRSSTASRSSWSTATASSSRPPPAATAARGRGSPPTCAPSRASP